MPFTKKLFLIYFLLFSISLCANETKEKDTDFGDLSGLIRFYYVFGPSYVKSGRANDYDIDGSAIGGHLRYTSPTFSNFGASNRKNATKIAEAIKDIHENFPNVAIDGELQADFVLNPAMLKKVFPFSKLVDKKVNVLIFPNLDSANITYKMMKELYDAESIGPIMMGLKKPAHILQLGASVDEIVNMTAIAVIDAQEKSKN